MDDLISRQAAIEAILAIKDYGNSDRANALGLAECAITTLPSAQPERKTGTWIPVTNGRGGHECDLCHNYAPAWQTGEERLTDFCPNCGAYMGGEQDE